MTSLAGADDRVNVADATSVQSSATTSVSGKVAPILPRVRRPDRRWLLAAVIGVLVCVAVAFIWFERQPPAGTTLPRQGVPAPEFALPLLDGGTADLKSQRGHVVVLNFWATWCGPCRSEMPALQQVADDLQGQSFTLFEIDLQEDRAAIEPFRQDLRLRLTIVLDEDGAITQRYGVRALPSTFLIDQDGILRQQRLGPLVEGGTGTAWSPAWLEDQVQTLLSRDN